MKKLMLVIGFALCIGVGIFLGLNMKEPALAESNTDLTNISVEKLEEQKVKIEDITVKMLDNKYATFSFSFVLNTKEGAEELSKRNFQIKSFVIKYLTNIESTKLKEESSSQTLLEDIKIHMNEQMHKGQILETYMSNKLILNP
ncbi:flagellar basal body-associated FliL family protein [Niallia sp. Krafla_26]|uniref:flagellar basal body-associated FliL family protein n=1 Tax=Niallia sp. Krafla_26 TaxID=3064703 RepID=UPI003D174A48